MFLGVEFMKSLKYFLLMFHNIIKERIRIRCTILDSQSLSEFSFTPPPPSPRKARKLWRFIKLLEKEDDSLYRSRLLILFFLYVLFLFCFFGTHLERIKHRIGACFQFHNWIVSCIVQYLSYFSDWNVRSNMPMGNREEFSLLWNLYHMPFLIYTVSFIYWFESYELNFYSQIIIII